MSQKNDQRLQLIANKNLLVIPLKWKQKYAKIFAKGWTREARDEVQALYKKDFPETFPNFNYVPMER